MTAQNHNSDLSPQKPSHEIKDPDAASGTNDSAPEQIPAMRQKPSCEGFRRFLACNPFYLVSAALLLYSFYLVSADTAFLKTEIAQLSFNLGSLQIYELVVVVTAIWLAQRLVWYDSTLLVGLENLLALVPFILVSEAALIEARVVWVLCAGAALLAALRGSLLRRFIQELNFPPRLLGIGLLVLLVNAGLPVVYRILHQSKFGTKPDWGGAYETNQYIWLVLVPVLCALSLLVPFSRRGGGESWPGKGWLPLGIFSLWLAGTSVHLYCLGYVYDFSLRPELVAPAVWTLCWALALRLERELPDLKSALRKSLWVLPLMATLLAAGQREKGVFLVLTTLNVGAYGMIWLRTRVAVGLHLLLISGVALLAGLPEPWGRAVSAEFTRESFIGGAAVLYALVCIALSRSAKLGLLGALLSAMAVGVWGRQHVEVLNWALQAGLVFLLAHSLRWRESEEQGAAALRWLAALAWVAHSVLWTHYGSAGWGTLSAALPVLALYLVSRWVRGEWGSAVVLVSGLVVLLTGPGDLAAKQLTTAPAGLLALIGSFALFALGTLGALTKHRWSPGN